MSLKSEYKFPIGYHDLHEQANINFQLNRLITNGGSYEEIKELAPKIKDFNDWKRELVALAEKALGENRTLNAAMYYRAAEFFVAPNDLDKEILYDKFIDLFYSIYKNAVDEKVEIPYENSFLPGIHLTNDERKGIVVIHGGYDSFLEEFYLFGSYFRDNGYEVILFEGPGQGAALKKNKFPMIHEWEKPVKAVLDYFNLDNVALIGISLGGYLGLRAAAFEPRISKVIAFDIIYDFFEVLLYAGGPKVRKMIESFLDTNQIDMLNKVAQRMMKNDLLVNWGLNHGMYVFGVNNPFEFLQKARLFSTATISDKITCDVLLLAGTNDHFIPIEMFYNQIEALKNVKSLTCRMFTEKEHAANHCQIGNYKLVLDFMLNWMDITK